MLLFFRILKEGRIKTLAFEDFNKQDFWLVIKTATTLVKFQVSKNERGIVLNNEDLTWSTKDFVLYIYCHQAHKSNRNTYVLSSSNGSPYC